jgi:hypothetical protein
MKVDKRKKTAMPDLRRVKGAVSVTDTNANFAGKSPSVEDTGLGLASPDVGVGATGQTTHE